MLKELVEYWLEKPSLKEAKNFSHLKESIALVYREQRCQNEWLPHRNNCREFITNHLSKLENYNAVLILGSGPLHEVPIETLSTKFHNVTLVDIVHLNRTKKNVSHLKNLHFIEHDISELEKDISKGILKNKVPVTFLDQKWDLIVSLNLMSQIPIHLEKYILKNKKYKINEEDLQKFIDQISYDHLSYLNKFDSTVLLITDTQVILRDKKQKIIQIQENFPKLTLPKAEKKWVWNNAPLNEYAKDMSMEMEVQAFVLK